MASKRKAWQRLGRYFSAIVIAAFFLPFFGVSCEGMEVVTVSGADMVGGCKPGGMISEMEKQEGRARRDVGVDEPDSTGGGGPSMSDSMGAATSNVEREPLAIVALVLIVLGFGAAWVRTRTGLIASLVLAVATIGVLVALWFKIGGALREAVDKETLGKADGMKSDVKIDAGGRYGLWLSGIMLLTIIGFTARALREPENMPDAPPPMLPPPGPPPV
ncbi:MAG: hypothetical protein H0T46_24520 [Deltaproteobacteria bacterium]|nr:hypothetical protein [Deltaproteobacteria bacterium]